MNSSSDNKETYPLIALAGNPNVGKSTLFNALTGLRQHTGNWSGKTVELAYGEIAFNKFTNPSSDSYKKFTLVDLPGCYSLNPCSIEESVAHDFLAEQNPDCVIAVLDATCFRRSLALALQVLELNKNTVLAVNLIDEAEKNGIFINTELLSSKLNVPVVPCSAKRKEGLDLLLKAVGNAVANPNTQYIGVSNEKLLTLTAEIANEVIIDNRKGYSPCTKKTRASNTGGLLDRIVTGKYTSFPIMFLLLMVIFYITITGANYPSEILSIGFNKLEGLLYKIFNELHIPAFITNPLLAGIFRTLGRVISVMLPPMAIFFPLFTLAEDFGYLPRVAFNLDRCFRCCNTCGKQAITMCMGFGCNATGVMGCRIISSPRERLIAILTNTFVPCNGRFPMLIAIISIFVVGLNSAASGMLAALILAAVVTFAIGITLIMSKLLSVTLLKGKTSAFTLELPPYRAPRIGQVIVRSVLDRTLLVLARAALVAAPAGLLIYLLANINIGNTSLLTICSSFIDPFARIMGLDGVILIAFILSFPANELVIPIMLMTYTSGGSYVDASGFAAIHEILLANGWTIKTAICFILFTLMHWPCSTTFLTIKKESGEWKWAFVGLLVPTLCGILICTVVNLIF